MKVTIQKSVHYRGENLTRGDVVDIDDEQAARWVKAGYASEVDAPTKTTRRKAKKVEESE